MNTSNEKSTAIERVVLVSTDAERRQLIEAHPHAVLVSDSLPLRANLSVIENITVALQFSTDTYIGEDGDAARELLNLVSFSGCAERRDPDLTCEERFVAKLLRVIVLAPSIILIDRPAQLLPDSNYPFFLNKLLLALDGRFEQCLILDYTWNAPLYNSRA